MTEAQFAYNGFTLDELRSLAASPQVATMQAMPQSFRALADRVAEVADLLTHAQADLPNWWKGPAADQAAATLGRAAAEAREFHDSAIGAATAIGRCAQVVAEQQHQMMNVPEVPEPVITDVVQRPATPYEALEAARQDASYQAAHEQAVQVVNGIAAQYVETHRKLANIGAFRAENFAPSTAVPPAAESDARMPFGGTSHSTESTTATSPQSSEPLHKPAVASRSTAANISARTHTLARTPRYTAGQPGTRTANTPDAKFPFRGSTNDVKSHVSADRAAGNLSQGRTKLDTNTDTSHSASDTASKTPLTNDAEILENLPSDYLSSHYLSANQLATEPPGRGTTGRSNSAKLRRRDNGISNTNEYSAFDPRHSGDSFEIEGNTSTNQELTPFPLPQRAQQTQIDQGVNDNLATCPPYCGIVSAPRTYKERNPRPAYLKERKSVWLPDTVAAPADGVLTPDWFEPY